MELTDTERTLVLLLRTLKPLETVIIRSDPQGKIHKFMVNRVYTAWIENGVEKAVVQKISTLDLKTG